LYESHQNQKFAKAYGAIKSEEEEFDLIKECAELRELSFRSEIKVVQ